MSKKTIHENIVLSERGPTFYKDIKRLEKKKDATCLIKCDKDIGSGFFCEMKINNEKMKFLFTANHIFNHSNILEGKNFKIIWNEKEIEIETKNRLIFKDDDLDYACIELLESENMFKDFFQIYHKIENNEINSKDIFIEDEIGDIHYPESYLSIEFGRIVKFQNSLIVHSIPTSKGSSGSPLILINRDLELIGIHIGSMNNEKLNHGICFIDIINNIKEQINSPLPLDAKLPYEESEESQPKKKKTFPLTACIKPFEIVEDEGKKYPLYSWVRFANIGSKWYFF